MRTCFSLGCILIYDYQLTNSKQLRRKIKMNYKAVNVYTRDLTQLMGVLFSKKKSNWLMIAITGVHGNFYSNPFYVNIGKTLSENGIDFLYAQTRDAFSQMESVNPVTGKKKIIGAYNEDFNKVDDDIEAYLRFAEKEGYEHVVLAGHSLGANKVIHYLSVHDDPRVDRFIFLSPANVRHLTSFVSTDEEMIIHNMVNQGKGQEMIPFQMFGWLPALADTAEQWLTSPIIDNVHSSADGDFSQLERINKKGAMIIGTYDTFTKGNPKAFLKNINNHMKTAKDNKLIFIPETGHTYQEKEQVLADDILNLITSWMKVAKNA